MRHSSKQRHLPFDHTDHPSRTCKWLRHDPNKQLTDWLMSHGQSHIRKAHACLAVTCHLHFWQNDRDLLHAIAVTRGWNDIEIRVSTESRPWRRKFPRRSCRDSNTRPFNHESGALTTELSTHPKCSCGYSRETAEHYLLHCPNYINIRARTILIPSLAAKPILEHYCTVT